MRDRHRRRPSTLLRRRAGRSYAHDVARVRGARCASRVFLPPQARSAAACRCCTTSPGLTCTEENFIDQGGRAARSPPSSGSMLVAPDTSPRGARFPGDDDSWDFGAGRRASTSTRPQAPWSRALPDVQLRRRGAAGAGRGALSGRHGARGIFGHSMGGHGALVVRAAQSRTRTGRCRRSRRSCAPMRCPWGEKAFGGYLGADRERWRAYDATRARARRAAGADRRSWSTRAPPTSSSTTQLKPELLAGGVPRARACRSSCACSAGYDHSYYFIATFVDDHLRHHARHLGADAAA